MNSRQYIQSSKVSTESGDAKPRKMDSNSLFEARISHIDTSDLKNSSQVDNQEAD